MKEIFTKNAVVKKGFKRALHVPQGFCGLSKRPANQFGYMTTTVAQCVALALVGWNDDNSYPLITLAHLDDTLPGSYSAQWLIRGMETDNNLSERYAYVLNGDSNPELYDPILRELEQARYDTAFHVDLSQVSRLTIDLTDGKPVHFKPKEMIEYVPNAKMRPICDNFVFSDRCTRDRPVPHVPAIFHASDPSYLEMFEPKQQKKPEAMPRHKL